MREFHVPQLCFVGDSLSKIGRDSTVLLVTRAVELAHSPCKDSLSAWGFVEMKRSIPAWIQRAEKHYAPLNRDEVLILFERRKNKN